MLGVQLAVMVFAALAPANAGAADPKAPLTFAQTAEFAASAPGFIAMEFGIAPGLEGVPRLDRQVPGLKDFPTELVKALDAADALSRSAALLYLARLTTQVRGQAWLRDRDKGDDLFAVALGPHARAIRSGLEKALEKTQGRDRLLAAVSLLALVKDHPAALKRISEEMRASTPARRREACEWANRSEGSPGRACSRRVGQEG
jgi:hypothetical protein